jgi:hypothetical protein
MWKKTKAFNKSSPLLKYTFPGVEVSCRRSWGSCLIIISWTDLLDFHSSSSNNNNRCIFLSNFYSTSIVLPAGSLYNMYLWRAVFAASCRRCKRGWAILHSSESEFWTRSSRGKNTTLTWCNQWSKFQDYTSLIQKSFRLVVPHFTRYAQPIIDSSTSVQNAIHQ